MTLDKKFLKKIKGDASFRSFYRKEYRKKKSIIVAAKKEKKKNLLIYDAINNGCERKDWYAYLDFISENQYDFR